MKRLKYVIFCCVFSSLSACASFTSYSLCDVPVDTGLPILHPVALKSHLIVNQQVTIANSQNQFEFLSQLEIRKDKLILVALTPIGQKLFQIQYSKQDIQFERFGIPDSFNPAYLLSDISLVYGEDEILNTCYQQAGLTSYTIATKDRQRTITYPGQAGISITYTKQDRWLSDVQFNNMDRNYTIMIKSLGVEYL